MSSTHIHESIVINAPLDKVWAVLSSLDFKWWSIVQSVKPQGESITSGLSYEITFKDKTVQTFQLAEFSSINEKITFFATQSEPPVDYSSVYHTIKATNISVPPAGMPEATFVEWKTDVSSDASQAVIQDLKYKRREALQDLVKHMAKK